MITAGALLCPKGKTKLFNHKFRTKFSFLATKKAPYSIPPFNFTLRERHVLDSIVTSKARQNKKRKEMRKIGFKSADIEDYKNLIRFVPKYFESYL